MSDGLRRWRLVLGRYANEAMGGLSGRDAAADQALDYLYAREYLDRGLKTERGPGTLDPTQMEAVRWLDQARELFPHSVFETLQAHALDRYGLTEILNDPEALDALEPSRDLLKLLLGFHGRANPEVKAKLREIASIVIDEILQKLKADFRRALAGRRNRFSRSNIKSAANFDWQATLRQNLKTWDPERQRIIADQLRFNARERRRLPWTIILCVDQSGSMSDSIIHSAVMVAILSGLPGVRTKMVLFDSAILDVSDRLTDPLETLLSVQLGGGTSIGKAVAYCENLIDTPERTVFALITDFGEGESPTLLYQALARMSEQRVRLIGLTALDEVGQAGVDMHIAQRVVSLGMKVGAMTPDQFANWLADIIR